MAVRKGNNRITATITDDMKKNVEYYAAKRGITINEYIAMAIEKMIAFENQDYDLPTLEQARLNQLIDTVTVLSSNVHSLEQVITSGFDSLLGLTRGDNYLLESEDGDI